MAMEIRCDICWKKIEPSNTSPVTWTFGPYEEMRGATVKKTTLMHFCNPCLIRERKLNIYIENPYFVEPPKEPEPKE